MKRFASIVPAAILTGALLASCGQPVLSNKTATQLQTTTLSPSTPEVLESAPPSPSPAPVTYPDISDLEFSDLTGVVFIFSSGVGAWHTEVQILSDGTFSGYYSDQDMGDIGSGYPNGTRYFCSFNGKFSSLKKVGEYEYSMKCESITQDGIADELEIEEDGWRYITSTPYGFDSADEFMLYLPGKRIDELPDELINWISMSRGIDFKGIDILHFYGLYNIEGEQGFSSQ